MTQLQEYLDKKRNALPLKLNIQYFAAEGDPTPDPDPAGGDPEPKGRGDDPKGEPTGPGDVTFTPEQQKKMDDIIKKRVADEQKKASDALAEAKKLEKMNAEQKQTYELEKANNRIAELEAKENLYKMSKEASKMLSDKGIGVTDDLLEQVTKDTAEDTQKAVSTFLNIVDSEVQKQVAEKLRGGAPKGTPSNPNTKKALKDYSYAELSELKEKHPAQYAELTKNN